VFCAVTPRVLHNRPDKLLHMDTVGPTQVHSEGGKLYILVIVDDFSCYSCVFFIEGKDEAFPYARDWFFGCKMSYLRMASERFTVTMAHNSKILILRPSVLLWASSISFPLFTSLAKWHC
jgi:hypothetical protein